jgi:hypothetical protein
MRASMDTAIVAGYFQGNPGTMPFEVQLTSTNTLHHTKNFVGAFVHTSIMGQHGFSSFLSSAAAFPGHYSHH